MDTPGRGNPVSESFDQLGPGERDERSDRMQQMANKTIGGHNLEQKITSAVIGGLEERISSMFDRTLKQVGMTSETLGLLHLLAAKSGDSQQAILEKALTFYGIALDAREKGNHIAILNDGDEIVREIKGFEPSERTAEPVTP